ncbi:hypothetical protein SDC9_198217 [bioreactor metagenome]|uniref:Uncharacterized protein n=1 Tax=bioreactor metagenome TaxID=1076179 RepID=A0A645IHW5_9ZZZZ
MIKEASGNREAYSKLSAIQFPMSLSSPESILTQSPVAARNPLLMLEGIPVFRGTVINFVVKK